MSGAIFQGKWRRLRDRATAATQDAAASAIAVGLSWLLARWLAGHERPMFAVVTAVICLAPGLPNHGRQAVSMLMGVFTGIAVGELSLLLPIGDSLGATSLRLTGVTFLAIVLASLWGQSAVTVIQAGVSALMVLTMGPVAAGPERLIDVLIGTAVGLFFSQVLLTPDPLKMLETGARSLLSELAQGMLLAEKAVRTGDVKQAQQAAQQLGAARVKLMALDGGISLARDSAHWTLRGWRAGPKVAELAARYDRHAARIYAQGLILGDELYHALRDEPGKAPAPIADLLHLAANNLADPDHAHPMDRARLAEIVSVIDPKAEHWRAVATQAVALSAAGRQLLALPAEARSAARASASN
ncbi:FUSC family protein [Paenirhodobacter populi]|uniref:Aromatic acid exporter family protein n=1 Tax=Paenirhodobacter populi TaxID=2306993 RepID=A0A443JTV8_9RHOB|nr:FUSC family protein [Sinirhodobacter populi]RWR23932.1 aromatic acid exporter family protein [Sinirhodobacter populi]